MVTTLLFSPDGKTIASGSADYTVRLWNAETGELMHTLTGHAYTVQSVSFSPDGSIVASGSDDIRIWDANTGAHIRKPYRAYEFGLQRSI